MTDAEPTWWWLSFCDTTRPEGQQFLGVVIVSGEPVDEVDELMAASGGGRDVGPAIRRAHRLGINPGGQVAGIPLAAENVPAEEYRERLLSRDDLAEAGIVLRVTR